MGNRLPVFGGLRPISSFLNRILVEKDGIRTSRLGFADHYNENILAAMSKGGAVATPRRRFTREIGQHYSVIPRAVSSLLVLSAG